VVWPNGITVNGALVQVRTKDEAAWSNYGHSDQSGAFTLPQAEEAAFVRAFWAEGAVRIFPYFPSDDPVRHAPGISWSSASLQVKDLLSGDLILDRVFGSSPNTYQISGSVRMEDGSPIPPRSRVFFQPLPGGPTTRFFFIQPGDGSFLVPHSGFTRRGFVDRAASVESWRVRVETSHGAEWTTEIDHPAADSWIRGVDLAIPDLPFFEGEVISAESRESVEAAVIRFDDSAEGEDPLTWVSNGDWEVSHRSDDRGRFRIYLQEGRLPNRLRVWKGGFQDWEAPPSVLTNLVAGTFLRVPLQPED